jgi:hypothetical protein
MMSGEDCRIGAVALSGVVERRKEDEWGRLLQKGSCIELSSWVEEGRWVGRVVMARQWH